jgi:S-adenosylmethionine:tRNA ribosyltransferase-isomerase
MSKHPSGIDINDYNYELPQDKIAVYPLEKRDDSKLLVFKNRGITDTFFKEIYRFLEEDSILIFNNTRVIQARLNFKNSKGQSIELFCLEPNESTLDLTQAMLTKEKILWKCLVGNLKKWRNENLIILVNGVSITARLIEKFGEFVLVEFLWQPDNLNFAEVLEKIGAMPIPPYLKRNSESSDAVRYQTIYAQKDGSVAAPTAGLHFTTEVSKKLKSKKINSLYVTLHVGAGTFKPVKSSTLAGHAMHAEWIEVTKETIEELIASENKKKIVVGTTSLRTIESLYWMGMKSFYNPSIKMGEIELTQWDPYNNSYSQISVKESLTSLLSWMQKNNLHQLVCKTSILIAPPYQLKIADGIITNFHQPQSTLLLLISSIVGDSWKDIYNHALINNYRFLSFGDSSLLLK